jgi:hypothetical protein
MSASRRDCERLKPGLVALVYEEEHPDTGDLLLHLETCPECSRERSDLELIRARAEQLPLAALDGAFLEGLGAAPGRIRAPRKGWILTHALPACAAALLVGLLFFGAVENDAKRLLPAAEDIFSSPAVAAARSFDGSELDRRLDWIASEIDVLEEESW